ncbi:hypothetical protein UY3_02875, partial [Chelonia mydas]
GYFFRNPLEITEKFIQKFNDATNPQDKEDLLELAKKMLARCKRRSGLGTLGSGKHVDLPVAWAEAIILAQCKGEIQEEAAPQCPILTVKSVQTLLVRMRTADTRSIAWKCKSNLITVVAVR